MINIEQKIIQKIVYSDGCWIWRGATRQKDAYPSMRINGKTYRVGELVLNIFVGVDVPSNMDIATSCNNSLCVNPKHLYPRIRAGKPNFKNRVERHKRNIQDRFWEKVDTRGNGCWEWLASLDGKGYGQFGVDRKVFRSHRLVYEFVYGKINDNLEVCHTCDNPKCCNPSHLFLGTHADNMKDMKNKGRRKK